jgi:hypothetical protein
MKNESWNPVSQQPDVPGLFQVRLPNEAESVAGWTGRQWELIEEREPEGGHDGYSSSSGVTCEITHWRAS